mgnify:CR=1 FL=1
MYQLLRGKGLKTGWGPVYKKNKRACVSNIEGSVRRKLIEEGVYQTEKGVWVINKEGSE